MNGHVRRRADGNVRYEKVGQVMAAAGYSRLRIQRTRRRMLSRPARLFADM